VQRFGVMGSAGDGLRIALTARVVSGAEEPPGQEGAKGPVLKAQKERRDPDEFLFSMERTDLLHPVEVTEVELRRRWPIIEQLAAVLWSKGGGWTELATAARGFSEGTQAATAEDAFVKYVVALDVLLGREETGYAESQITRISERLAFLLGEADSHRRWPLFKAFKPALSEAERHPPRWGEHRRGGALPDGVDRATGHPPHGLGDPPPRSPRPGRVR
jgi:hypothetical protein